MAKRNSRTARRHEDAYENLKLRLTPKEMELIIKEQYVRFPQRELQKHVHELGLIADWVWHRGEAIRLRLFSC